MAAMDALHRDSGMRTRMSEAARKRAVENLTWDKFRERILEAYRLAFAQQ
jgi:glycosyltransferase involved in cell wall biosynthesis